MNQLQVEEGKHCTFLNLLIWDTDTNYLHTVWLLDKLTNAEINFTGGRFRRYDPSVNTNSISFHISGERLLTPRSIFSKLLTWLGENTESGWNFDFTDDEPVPVGGGIGLKCLTGIIHLYFESDEEAVLCKLYNS